MLWAEDPPIEPSANTLASQSAMALPEVVVTADRLDTPVSQVASSMTVITAKDLERKQTTTVMQALEGVPALDVVQNGSPGQNSSVFIRGSNPEHTLVLLDGVPLNDPSSTAMAFDDLDHLMTDDVKQIEVVRGPQSLLYGSSAIGGVINILTLQGDGKAGGSLFFEGGTYGTFREGLSARGGNADSNFSLAVSRFDTDGFSTADKTFGNTLPNGDHNTTATLRLGQRPSPDVKTDLLFLYGQSRTALDDGGGLGADNPDYFAEGQQFYTRGQASLTLFNGLWEQVLGASFSDHLRKFTDNPSVYQPFDYNRSTYDGQVGQVDWQSNLRLLPGETVVAGIQMQQQRAFTSADFGSGPSVFDQTAIAGGYFLENEFSPLDGLYTSLGGRLDAYSSFGSKVTWRATAAYFVPGLETKLKATYGTGFRAPSLYQLYSPYGNAALLAETSQGWDAGFEQPFGGGQVKVGATYFYNRFENFIDYDYSTNMYFNNQTEARGVETFAGFKLDPTLETRLNYTYTDAHNPLTGGQLIRRPQQKGGGDIFTHWGSVDLSASVDYVGDSLDYLFPAPTYQPVPITLSSYWLVGLAASWQADEHFKFFGRVSNLLDQSYEQVYGYGTPGISFYAGTKISL